jgi:tetratricopeptide (TPR) repeat protein
MTPPTETAATVTVGQLDPTDPDVEADDDIIISRRAQRARARKAAATAVPATAATPVAAVTAAADPDAHPDAEADVDPDADPDIEDDDDIVSRTLGKRAAARTAAAPTRWGSRWLLVLALLVGVAAGAWYAGRVTAPAPEAEATADGAAVGADLAETETEVDNAARLAELAALLAENPDDADALLEQGVLLYEEGDYEAAGAAWRHVTELTPDKAEAWFNLGFYYLSIDPVDTAAARAAWEKVVALDPDSDLADDANTHLTGLLAEVEASVAAAAQGTDETETEETP